MKSKYFLMVLLLSCLPMGVFAAGSPMHENFTDLIALSNDAIEVGNGGDAQAFINSINLTLTTLKAQDEKGSSIRLQRASAKLKVALHAAKSGNTKEGVEAIQQAIEIMQEKKP
jgi:hypothetical protein